MVTCPAAGAAKSEKDNKNAAGSSHFFICEKFAFELKKRGADVMDVAGMAVEL